MEHSAHLVDILDRSGKVIAQKKRMAVNKEKDIYHAVYVFLITPRGELILGVIPPREDLPNMYVRQFGAPMATIRRHNETARQAALRGLSRELFIDEGDVHMLGEGMLDLPDNRHTYASAFYIVAEAPSIYSVIDIDTLAVVTPRQLRSLMQENPQEIAPTLKQIWERYSDKLPI